MDTFIRILNIYIYKIHHVYTHIYLSLSKFKRKTLLLLKIECATTHTPHTHIRDT